MKRIPGFEDYSISKYGYIWSWKKWKWIKSRLFKNGYMYVGLYKQNRQSWKMVHKLVLETFIGLCPKGKESRHLNGNRQDNRLENLCWGTRSENEQDKIKHRTSNRGSDCNGRTKLTPFLVRTIRYFYDTKLISYNELAELFDVSKSCIAHICKNRCWSYLCS